MMSSHNYFTCTLGEARNVADSSSKTAGTVNELLLHQSIANPDRPAVGFCDDPRIQGSREWTHCVYTFKQLHDKVKDYAAILSQSTTGQVATRTVALLCTSGRTFLFCWLALIRNGLTVVLIAPELSDAAVAHLCKLTGAAVVLHDSKHQVLAQNAVKIASEDESSPPLQSELLPDHPESPSPSQCSPAAHHDPSDVAYVHHTSGTSSGLPKAIPITHSGAVGVLPAFEDGELFRPATFTTTPLYHGGPADCFRAWTSSALIWLFPGLQDKPIAPDFVLRAVNTTKRFSEQQAKDTYAGNCPLRYFAAVPYVLETLSALPEGIDMFQSMDLVSVGGAALSKDLGDELVKKGVRLLSKFGSAECGFILSSHRDYENDQDWQYLREYPCSSMTFEPQEDNLAELVLKDWPFMAKTNRDDGSYATSDLFEPHPSTKGLWRYHSRADGQLTLSTGKKFDAAPLESQLMGSVRAAGFGGLVREIYVFGTNRPYPGCLVFRRQGFYSHTEVLDKVWPIIEQENAKGSPHARIARHMLVGMSPYSAKLQKTSKGTYIRREIEESFSKEIDNAYQSQSDDQGPTQPLVGASIRQNIYQIVKARVMGNSSKTELPVEEDLHALGADSVAIMEIREQVQRDYGRVLGVELPPNVVYECGSAEGLAKHIIGLSEGKAAEKEKEDNERMQDLLRRFGDLHNGTPSHAPSSPTNRQIVILTGVTGTLGIWIFHLLRRHPLVTDIHCLIRATDAHAAESRLTKALASKGLPPLSDPSLSSKLTIHLHPCKLTDPTLGLSPATLTSLKQTATAVIHVAWAVNFNISLTGFTPHLQGLHNLIAFTQSTTQRATFLFCSSTASVLSPTAPANIPERVSRDPRDASAMGYAQSKWIAEAICASAHTAGGLRDRIAILRIGQLCGDGERGVWNVTEAWPLMFSAVSVTGALPDLGEQEVLGWLKVDLAAQAVVQTLFSMPSLDRDERNKKHRVDDDDAAGCPVYHLINPHHSPTWTDMLGWVTSWQPDLEVLPPRQWVQRLENLQGEQKEHPARKLLGLWKGAYASEEGGREDQGVGGQEKNGVGGREGHGREDQGGGQGNGEDGQEKKAIIFEMANSVQAAPVLAEVKPIDELFFGKVWRWVKSQE